MHARQSSRAGTAGKRRGARSSAALLAFGASALLGNPMALLADEQQGPAEAANERFAIHAQMTYVEQETDAFKAPYAGSNSLSPSSGRETTDLTLSLGARLWRGAELWLTPEIDEGSGLNDTLGLAAFSSGEAYKVGRNKPYFRLPRAFVRETLNLGPTSEAVAGGANQLGGMRSVDRWVITAGKFSVADVFDTNQYAHDARSDFLNWTSLDAGTFDYAADAWGYTLGVAIERYQGVWALRGGVFDLSNVPNSEHLEPAAHEFQILLEAEHRHELLGQPGRALLTFFQSRGRMALLADAVSHAETAGGPIDLAAVRRFRSRAGGSIGLEQQLASDVGLFARAGRAAGNVEVYEFTDIDRSLALGLSIKGARWGRTADTVGIAGLVNGISATRENYLNAGGLGVLIGDGKLPHPGTERVFEGYYSLAFLSQAFLTLDYQHVTNPGYNRDRGPVAIVAVRAHAQF
jgi:high affinity Mn2+ porin